MGELGGYDIRKRVVNEHGDGFSWIRGSMIGKGSCGCVYRATLKNPSRSAYSFFPAVMAVKSAEVSVSGSIQKEREVLSHLVGCPNVIGCFGEETTMGETGLVAYNLLLEYGSGGTLGDRIQKLGRMGLDEHEVRVHTKYILRGLNHIHSNGYVHCDMKPHNILLVGYGGVFGTNFVAKIGDLGLAKKATTESRKRKFRDCWNGTPMYLSPETVIDNVQEPLSDVWAVGCIVFEMLTGKCPWEGEVEEVLQQIRTKRKMVKIPKEMRKEAMDFLKCCLSRNPRNRWSCERLLKHPFVSNVGNDDAVEEEIAEEVQGFNESESMALVSSEFDSCWSDEDVGNADHEVVYLSVEDKESRVLETGYNTRREGRLTEMPYQHMAKRLRSFAVGVGVAVPAGV